MKRTSLVVQMLAGVATAGVSYGLKRWQQSHDLKSRGSSGRIVLITGGSRGLGLAMAERFAKAGDRLVLTARNFEELMDARDTLRKRKAVRSAEDVLLIPADLTDPEQAKNLVEHAIAHFGRIDVLINNAGIMEVGPVEDQPLEAFQRAMATNFFAALHTTQAALPYLLYRDRAKPAAIVNICSVGGKVAVPHMLPYVASKFALVGFSEGLHAELRHKGVRVTTVCPGLMRTGGHMHAQFRGDRNKEARWFDLAATTPIVAVSVRRAANHIFHAVARGRAEILITPQAWLAARMAAVAPETTQRLASLANEFVLPAPIGAEQRRARIAEVRGIEESRTKGAPWQATAHQPVI
ncbi:MAG TPA: SDR family oxidoreductase [Edaphobacter sp.]|nr:SDR family oxidoreductase [Edaphobacter sp.]